MTKVIDAVTQPTEKIRVAIVGPTSYTALFLLWWLHRHEHVEVVYLASHRDELPKIDEEFPQLAGMYDMTCQPIDVQAISGCADVAFLCLPHVVSMQWAGKLVDAGLRVIDLSADYRLESAELYTHIYGHTHEDPGHLDEAVYGLPEWQADRIASARLIANPGCYPTGSILSIAPLVKAGLVDPQHIVINAASGITGAGRAAKAHLHFPEANEGFTAYAAGDHRHQPEIEQAVTHWSGYTTQALFVPHLLPVDRGILSTIYMHPLDARTTSADVLRVWHETYDDQPFVRIREKLPNIKWVRDTNFCDISVRVAGGHVIAFAAIDNMLKGACTQAIQNMNLIFGLHQTTGLL